MNSNCASEVVIIDFETTGLSPQFDRVIEVAAVIVSRGEVTDRFSQLMDPGEYIPEFITRLTGISDEMVRGKPSPEKTMHALKKFIGSRCIVAHNASFDKRFLVAEFRKAGLRPPENKVLCSMMLARRLVPDAVDHKLGTLVRHLGIDSSDRAHRAMADVQMTVGVWQHIYQRLCSATELQRPSVDVFENVSKKPKASVSRYMEKLRSEVREERSPAPPVL